MVCSVCGQDYGVAHNCAGVAAYMTPEEAAPFPSGFAPLYYFKLAFHIARWDDIAIRRHSRDPNAIYFGAFIWLATVVVILIGLALPKVQPDLEIAGPGLVFRLAVVIAFGVVYMAALTFLQLGLCHFIAKTFFRGSGTYLGLMRPLLLSWFVNILILIPVVGAPAAGIAWIAVLMLVFEEVHGIERLQAFFISVGINVAFFVIQNALPIPR